MDEEGNEVEAKDDGQAPPKPEGVDPQTANEAGEGEANTAPASAEVAGEAKAKEDDGAPKPAEGVGEETGKEGVVKGVVCLYDYRPKGSKASITKWSIRAR